MLLSAVLLRHRILALWLSSALCGCPLQTLAACKINEIATLPVTMTASLPLVTANVNGTEVKFIASSATMLSVISSASAAELNLKLRTAPRHLRIVGPGGSTQAQITTVNALGIAGMTLQKADFIVGGGESGQGSFGVLGQNVLAIGDVDYDLLKGSIRLMRPDGCGDSLAYWVKEGQAYSVMEFAWQPLTTPGGIGTAYINGAQISVQFATGMASSMISPKAAERAGITPAGGTVGSTKSYIGRFSSFKIGDEEIRNARLRVGNFGNYSVDMMLGVDFFLAHHIYVANSQHKVYFTYNGGPVFDLSRSPLVVTANGSSAETAAPSGLQSDEPTDAAGFSQRGAAFSARHDFAHALEDLTRACEMSPDNPDYFYQRGLLYWEHGQTTRALDDFYRVLELKPDHVLALKARADIHSGRKDLASAKADLDSVDQSASKEADVRLSLAQSYERLDYLDSALAQYDLWIAWHADDARLAQALNGRCWTRASLNQDLAKALIDCNKALKLTGPSSPLTWHVLASRGLVLLRSGEYEKSIADYTASLKLEFKNASALYGRGVAKIRMGKTEEGQADITEATWQWPRIGDQFTERGITP
jgi:tetratricopeptide (TPR) repeat protein/predicted aspartyl protease